MVARATSREFKPFVKVPANAATLRDWLGQAGEFDCEIGCGVGWHPIQYAKANPGRRLLAIEHTASKFARFERRLERHQLANLRGFHGNAISVLPALVGAGQVDRYIILYPNPQPKAQQANRRWHKMPFMQFLRTSLKPKGLLTMATNQQWYMAEAVADLCEHWGFELVSQREISLHHQPDWAFRTHFEKKYLLRGDAIFDWTVRKP
jgi:tRNA G46 methylase TrmB